MSTKQKKMIIVGSIILLLSILMEVFYIFRIDKQELPFKFEEGKFCEILDAGYETDIVNLKRKNKEWTALNTDPQIVFELRKDKNVGAVRIQLEKSVSENVTMQVYWADEKDAFAEGLSVSQLLKAGDTEITLVVPYGTYESLRVDLGNGAGSRMSIESIQIYEKEIHKTYQAGHFLIWRMLFWVVMFTLLTGIMICLKKQSKLEVIFVFVILFLGIIYMIMLPPYSAPDEERHIMTVYQYSSKLLGKESLNEDGKAILYEADAVESGAIYSKPTRLIYKDLFRSGHETNITDEMNATKIGVENIVDRPFVIYLPQIIGVTIGRILGCSWFTLLYLGRFFSILCFAICGYFSIKWIPRGKMILFAVATLPMFIELIASFSYDAVLLMSVYLYISYVLKLTMQREKITIRQWVLLSICCFLLAMQKTVYFPLFALLLMVPHRQEGEWKKKWGPIAILGAFSLLIAFLEYLPSIMGMFTARESGVSEGVRTYSIGDFISNPIKLIAMYWNTFLVYIDAYPQTLLGGRLGWLELDLPWMMLIVFIVILALAVMEDSNENQWHTGKQKLLLIGSAVISIGLIYASMLFSWTPNTSNVIIGVQGRYFLPLLPLLLFCGINTSIVKRKSIQSWLIPCIVIQNIFVIMKVIDIIMHR